MIDLQHKKCCFCESRITHIHYGNVEHFRPKAAFRQNKEDQLTKPGYFWLAYDWDNLFLACSACNQRYKENLFPLINFESRVSNPDDDILREKTVFIHPQFDEPEEHITFEEAFVRPKNNSERGKVSIQELGLERPDLYENRNEIFQAIDRLISIYKLIPSKIPEKIIAKSKVLAQIKQMTSAEHQYLNMIRANFSDFISNELINGV